MSDQEIAHIFEKAKSFVKEASNVIKARFESGFKTEEKTDSTLVTEVDLEVERLYRKRIQETFPEHGILGEEDKPHNISAKYLWVLDPIDGTQSFVHRVPTFGSLVAVLKDGVPIVGIIDHPALNENYSAALGLGAYCNDKRIKIYDNGTDKIDQNEIITSCRRRQWEISNQGEAFDQLWQKHQYIRVYYDCFALSRSIAGQSAASIELNVNLWDIAPCKVLVEEAGGRYVDLGKRTLANGKEVYSAIFGKPSATRVLESWIK